ncbi:DUF523 domain-containing protein [Marinobacteraceae bacterium S3BR75-40.1]
MKRILISACLRGEAVRYDGRGALQEHPLLRQWEAEGRLVRICPEMAGGLPTPRPPAEVEGADGRRVLAGEARVITRDGEDVTGAFRAGAEAALELARRRNCVVAILTEKSPSCGSSETYDGSFQGRRVAGEGVTAALLRQHGIRVFNQHQLEEVAHALAAMDQE